MKHLFRKTTALLLTICMIVGMTGLPITAYAEGLDSGDGDAATVAADKDALAIGFAGDDSAEGVTGNLTLVTTGASGSSIAWLSGNTDVITNDGTVTRPAIDAEDAEVILTATITCGEASDTKEFTVTVLKEEGLHMLLGPMSTVVWEGDGLSEATAFQVSSAEHLADIPNQGLGAHYIQTENIVLPTVAAGESNWTPIGDSSSGDNTTRFTGTYNGNNKTISNLTIDSDIIRYMGLFGYVGIGGTLENITLENVNINSSRSNPYVGGLAGYNRGNVTNCSVSGSITATESGAYIGGLVGGSSGGTIDNNSSSCIVTGGENVSNAVGGLIGYSSSTNITNSHSTGNVTGSSSVGGLVGDSYAGNITTCYSTGNVTGTPYYGAIGGLAGYASGTITECYSIGNVNGEPSISGSTGTYSAGGLVGQFSGSMTNSYSTGNVILSDSHNDTYQGGFIGSVFTNSAIIENCYSTGNVTNDKPSGGVTMGGFIGSTRSSMGTIYNPTVTSSYFPDTMEVGTYGKGTPLSATELIQRASYSGWDFDADWKIGEGAASPTLRWQPWTPDERITAAYDALAWDDIKDTNTLITEVTADLDLIETGAQSTSISWSAAPAGFIDISDGSVKTPLLSQGDQTVTLTATIGYEGGTEQTKDFTLTIKYVPVTWVGNGDADSPYEVSSAAHLDEIRTKGMDAHYIQTENIDLTGINWTPIGAGSFSGTYDGLGHTISNLTIDNSTLQYVGLFSRIENEGVLRNIQLANIEITALELEDEVNAGALAGSNSGSITGCNSTGTISCALNPSYYIGAYIGGLVGRNGGTLEDSYSAVEVDVGAAGFLDMLIGGLAGFNDGEIVRSYSSGSVTVNATAVNPGRYVNVGGLVGINDDSLLNCYSISDVTVDAAADATSAAAGGLAGMNYEDITNCYSTGLVSATGGATAGGLIGVNFGTSVSNSYYLDTAGTSAGGDPLTEAQMKQWDSFEGWDFDTVWKIGQNISYPTLQWQTWTTDEEITADLIALDWTDIQGTNGAESDVTAALVLITSGARGTAIAWSADPTGYINTGGGTLSKPYTDEVAVTLTATVSKGSGTPQTKSFSLTIKPLTPDEAITLDKDTLTWDIIKGTNSAENNVMTALVLPTTGTSGTTAITWSVDPTGNIDPASGAVTRPGRSQGDKTVTLTATISRDSGTPQTVDFTLVIKAESGGGGGGSSGGGSSGGGGSVTIPPEKKPDQPLVTSAELTPTVDKNGLASASVPDQAIKDAIAKAQEEAKKQGKTASGIGVSLDVKMPEGASSLSLTLSQSALQSLVNGNVQSLEIGGGIASLNLDLDALKEIQKLSTGSVTITIKPVKNLSAAAKKLIGARPVYDVTVSYVKDGKTVNITSLGKGNAILSFPYTPGKNEAVGWLFGVYVDGSGQATRISGSAYDANSRSIILSGNHFSVYGVGYTAPTEKYTDIAAHWAKESIDYVVGRGLFSGTTDTKFSPNTAMDRGMLVTVLGRLAGADVSAYKTSSFSDVAVGKYYLPYVEWAYKKGIISGIGGGKFAPERAVTREEIALILQNYAKATGYTLPVTREAITFADNSSIASAYASAIRAMQQTGIMVGGNGNKFNPKAGATRAEVAAMLHRYVKLTIDPATAQGWALNDDGRYMYYKDGKPVTGWQTIDGVRYHFYSTGILQTGWVKDGNNWRYYSGNKALTGWWDIGSETSKKRYYFDTNAVMVSGKWLQIDGKWYYFYSDGSLAVNTKIDGYEVDENGVRKTE